jgi:hypothetical protein
MNLVTLLLFTSVCSTNRPLPLTNALAHWFLTAPALVTYKFVKFYSADVAANGTDPEDVYPNTFWLPPTGMQRGSLLVPTPINFYDRNLRAFVVFAGGGP